MVELPLVSVVIATRNRPEMLREAIAAVLGQTYQGPIECIVVFDQADPDLSLERADEGRVVRVTTNQRTPGLAGARNTGVLAAAGEYVAFCDDDDFWRPSKLERQVATVGDAITSVTGIVIDYKDHETVRVPQAETFTLENLVRKRLMEAHPSTVMIRRDAMTGAVGLVDEEIPGSYAEDYDFIIRAVQAGPVAVVSEPLVVVQWGQSMFSSNWTRIVEAMDYMMNKHEAFRSDRRALGRLYGQRAFANAARGHRREAAGDVWKTVRLAPTERRAYVALLVLTGLVSAPKVMDMAHKRGRGI